MAHLPSMNLPLDGWVKRIGNWIFEPDPKALLNATIFFDMRAVYGDEGLAGALKRSITGSILRQPSFLNYLAANAIQNPPPLSFFNQFIVETSGEHKNDFDIKKRAIMPLVDAARVLALEHQYYESVSTIDRFRNAGNHEPRNKALYEESIHAFYFLMKMRARNGLIHGDDGRFINIKACDNIDKKILKEIFQVIREVQKLIHVRFQLDYFR
jgi:CBS domain-containing protein